MNRIIALLASCVLATFAFSTPTPAAELFPAGTTGYDVSFPQCTVPLPSPPFGFGIVGATGGRAFTQNPCLATQFAWAARSGQTPSLYMNLKSPIGMNADEANTGPSGTCREDEHVCRAYNFGYKTAQHAVAYARAQNVTPATWWLDIETTSSWSTDLKMNAVLIGASIDYLKSQGATVGIYSAPDQWLEIAGTYSPGLPMWIAMAPNAAAAPSFCARPFAGGEIHLVQYIVNGFDNNYACRAVDRIPVPPVPATPVGPAGSFATIASGGDCLNLRAQAGLTGTTIGCLAHNSSVTLLEGAVMADGLRWQKVLAGPLTGWVAAQYLQAGGAPPTPTATPTAKPSGTFASTPAFGASGQSLAVYIGGTVDQLEAAASAIGASGIWAQESSGAYRLLIVRGPAFANAPFRTAFPQGFATTTAVTLTRL